jgi:hypothetical protein
VTGIARQLLPGTKPRARDPRVDPIPGDVVVVQRRDHKRGTWVETARRVTFSSPWTEPVEDSEVRYQATPRPLGVDSRPCSLRAWRRWATDGRVVCLGGPS